MLPKVSAICPTRNRPQWIMEAVGCFLSQTYPNRELIIVDDDDAPSLPNGINVPGIIYQRLHERKSIGLKRNACCELASGAIIWTLDNDDWSGPGRMADQVQRLIDNPKMLMTGYDQLVFANQTTQQAWEYRSGSGVCGTSMCYWRSFWQLNRFRNLQVGEDVQFVGIASRAAKLLAVPAREHMVSWLHDSHTWNRQLTADGWRPCEYPNWM